MQLKPRVVIVVQGVSHKVPNNMILIIFHQLYARIFNPLEAPDLPLAAYKHASMHVLLHCLYADVQLLARVKVCLLVSIYGLVPDNHYRSHRVTGRD